VLLCSFCVCLCAGVRKTTFSKNVATAYGADLAALDNATMHVTGATLTGGVAESGGSIYTWANGTITLEACAITSAKATRNEGGCIYSDTTSTVRLVESLLASCQSLASGGGIYLQSKAQLVVADSNITGCTAAKFGGAIMGDFDSSIVLNNARITGNTATEGGGLYLANEATLQLPTTSHFQNNTASYIGAGVRLFSIGFNPEDVSGRLIFKGNKAFRGSTPDVSVGCRIIAVADTGNAANYIPSANTRDGLYFTLNVSGPYGLASDDEVPLALIAKDGTKVFEGMSLGDTGEVLRKVTTFRPQAAPGEWDATHNLHSYGGASAVGLGLA
jgi:hypothetical protein